MVESELPPPPLAELPWVLEAILFVTDEPQGVAAAKMMPIGRMAIVRTFQSSTSA